MTCHIHFRIDSYPKMYMARLMPYLYNTYLHSCTWKESLTHGQNGWKVPRAISNNLGGLYLRATYTMVEKCTVRLRIWVQDMAKMVCPRRGKEAKFFEGQVLWRPSFLSEGLRLPKKLDLRRIPLQKSIATLAAMSNFHPCTKFFTKGLLVVV